MAKKRFRELSRSQKYRRLKHMQISKNFVPENVNSLNQEVNNYFKDFNQNASNYLLNQNISNHVSQFVLDNNICNDFSENMVTNTAIDQSNVVPISTFSTFEIETKDKTEHLLSNNKQISLREKLILWTDKHKIEQKSLTSLLNVLKGEGHDNLPNDGRILINTPRSTILYTRSGGYYYHYGLQNGIIDQLKQLNMLIRNNVIYINVNIDGLPISKSSKSQLWPILAQIVSEVLYLFLSALTMDIINQLHLTVF